MSELMVQTMETSIPMHSLFRCDSVHMWQAACLQVQRGVDISVLARWDRKRLSDRADIIPPDVRHTHLAAVTCSTLPVPADSI